MSTEQMQMSVRELLAKGWELTQQSMALVGLTIPYYLEFQIDGANQIRATRVATLDDLAKAIGALDADIERLNHEPRRAITVGDEIERLRQMRASSRPPERGGSSYFDWLNEEKERLSQRPPTDIFRFVDRDIEELRRDRASLLDLQNRCSRSGCPTSTTVIEALFPDVPIKKKTAGEKAEIERWLAIRKEAGLKIDPATAEVDWSYGQTLDPYGVLDEWELPEEFHQIGREYWACAPASDVWVSFSDLPKTVRETIWARHRSRIAFPAGSEGMPATAKDDFEAPF